MMENFKIQPTNQPAESELLDRRRNTLVPRAFLFGIRKSPGKENAEENDKWFPFEFLSCS